MGISNSARLIQVPCLASSRSVSNDHDELASFLSCNKEERVCLFTTLMERALLAKRMGVESPPNLNKTKHSFTQLTTIENIFERLVRFDKKFNTKTRVYLTLHTQNHSHLNVSSDLTKKTLLIDQKQ